MEVTFINEKNVHLFASMMDADDVRLIQEGSEAIAFGLVDDGKLCGAIAGKVEDNMFNIDSIYVLPAFRRRGGASMLLTKLRSYLDTEEFNMGSSVVIDAVYPDNELLFPFLESMGYTEYEPADKTYVITAKDIISSERLVKEVFDAGNTFEELDADFLDEQYKFLNKLDVHLPAEGFNDPSICPDLSSAFVHNGAMFAYLTVNFAGNNEFYISSLANISKIPEMTLFVIWKSVDSLLKGIDSGEYDGDTKFYITTTNKNTESLIHLLFDAIPTVTKAYRMGPAFDEEVVGNGNYEYKPDNGIMDLEEEALANEDYDTLTLIDMRKILDKMDALGAIDLKDIRAKYKKEAAKQAAEDGDEFFFDDEDDEEADKMEKDEEDIFKFNFPAGELTEAEADQLREQMVEGNIVQRIQKRSNQLM
ncbi:MAG: GNAT family N-acetyltransferase [Lachnospiraceae bacterium]|nr:GNAT family N-acetyltransferase [Lachnospiraceae bacterium]